MIRIYIHTCLQTRTHIHTLIYTDTTRRTHSRNGPNLHTYSPCLNVPRLLRIFVVHATCHHIASNSTHTYIHTYIFQFLVAIILHNTCHSAYPSDYLLNAPITASVFLFYIYIYRYTDIHVSNSHCNNASSHPIQTLKYSLHIHLPITTPHNPHHPNPPSQQSNLHSLQSQQRQLQQPWRLQCTSSHCGRCRFRGGNRRDCLAVADVCGAGGGSEDEVFGEC